MATYSLEELKRHNNSKSLWVSHGGKVYDVTAFADRHPGGSDVLLEKGGGGDVTGVMETFPHVHSPAAYKILNKYLIGELDSSANPILNGSTEEHFTAQNGSSVSDHRPVGPATSDQYSSPPGTGTTRDEVHTGGHSMNGWREDEIVDWNKPIFWQVGKLGKNYSEWVHSPVDRHIRLFYSDFCEFFSETPWWVIPLLWLPIVTTFLLFGIRNLKTDPLIWNQMSWWSTLLTWLGFQPGSGSSVLLVTTTLFLGGLVLWTFLEYTVHRWLFHLDPPPNSPFLITAHFILHGQHHKAPFDKGRLVFPPVPASGFAITFWALLMLTLPRPIAQIVLSGVLLGYVCYDLTHYFLHHGKPPSNYFKRLKSYHVKHHFTDQKKGFGISSKLWDYPFNTVIPDDPDSSETTGTFNNNKKMR